jgi:hypothetical protein
MRWAGNSAHVGKMKNAYKILVGKPEGKRPLERPKHRWEDNVKLGLKEIGWDGEGWINVAQVVTNSGLL